tara:strand:- start:168 stop:806 length:639 start_codon:yes stop_codon:yes gene_type:complete
MHEYVTRYDYTFLTGAPGSRWSGIGQIITENFNYNTEDETDWRVYRHGDFSGHTGSYFGPSMELGHDFHRLETRYGNDITEFKLECDRAFDGKGTGTKMIKCHQFAYNLDWLYNNVPNSNILLVQRGNKECFDWWKQAGGWDITYPKYDWYMDDHHMQHYIEAENLLANLFVDEWSNFTEEWITDNFGKHSIKLDMKKYHDVKVCLVRTNKT